MCRRLLTPNFFVLPITPNHQFTAKEINPLASLDEWEEAVLERYPVAGEPAKTKEEFRNYEETVRNAVREFYRLNHTYQNYSFVKEKQADYLKFDKKQMPEVRFSQFGQN